MKSVRGETAFYFYAPHTVSVTENNSQYFDIKAEDLSVCRFSCISFILMLCLNVLCKEFAIEICLTLCYIIELWEKIIFHHNVGKREQISGVVV